MRGKLGVFAGDACNKGITPAGAGKTNIRRCVYGIRRGSPPQVRGKRLRASNTAGHTRITPAGAGKTVQPYQPVGGFWDHPRRCGENFASIIRGTPFAGSPPQVRGKPSVSPHFVLVYRITPAGAGKTRHDTDFCPQRRGSPPQVRGKLSARPQCCLLQRITPAGAGKTQNSASAFRAI